MSRSKQHRLNEAATALADPVSTEPRIVTADTTTVENTVNELMEPQDGIDEPSAITSEGCVISGDPRTYEEAAALVTNTITHWEYGRPAWYGLMSCWERFVELKLAAVNAQNTVRNTKADDGAFSPKDVVTYLTDRLYARRSLKRKYKQDFVCKDHVLTLFALVFAMGHALPTIRCFLQRRIDDLEQASGEELETVEQEIAEWNVRLDHVDGTLGSFKSLWDKASDSVDKFMSGSITAASALQNLLVNELPE